MRPVPVGQLPEYISLQEPTRTADGAGGYTEAWADLDPANVFARIVPASASAVERVMGGKVQGALSYLVTIREHDGVTLQTRVTWGSKTLAVRGIETDNWSALQTLACEEVA